MTSKERKAFIKKDNEAYKWLINNDYKVIGNGENVFLINKDGWIEKKAKNYIELMSILRVSA